MKTSSMLLSKYTQHLLRNPPTIYLPSCRPKHSKALEFCGLIEKMVRLINSVVMIAQSKLERLKSLTICSQIMTL